MFYRVFCQLLAPWAPFISDEIWRGLNPGKGSVHLTDWPKANKPDSASTKLLEEMAQARQYIVEGLAQRAAAAIKVRQPLNRVSLPSLPDEYKDVVADELNVKEVIYTGRKVLLDVKLTEELKSEGIMRELVRHIQNARKKAGLNVEDRIRLALQTEDKDIMQALSKFKDIIYKETLANSEHSGTGGYKETVKVGDAPVTITLDKA